MKPIKNKTEMRGFIKGARASLRDLEQALKDNELDYAIDLANDAAGRCGEVENLLREQA